MLFRSLHGPGYSGGSALSHYYFSGNESLHTGYHIFRLDWYPNSVKFYVDNELVGTERKSTVAPDEWVFNARFYLILNLATGGNFDSGALDDTIESRELKIDWIRYTTLNGMGTLYRY